MKLFKQVLKLSNKLIHYWFFIYPMKLQYFLSSKYIKFLHFMITQKMTDIFKLYFLACTKMVYYQNPSAFKIHPIKTHQILFFYFLICYNFF